MNLFDSIFRHDLDTPAVLFEDLRISYSQLREETIRFARLFAHLKVSNGDRVALLLNDSPEFLAAFVALCSSGAIAVPINMALGVGLQTAILNDCGAKLAVIEGDVCDALLVNEGAGIPPLREIVVVNRATVQSPNACIQKLWDLDALFSEIASSANSWRFPRTEPSGPAFILYTSGSTGEPKGAVHSQANIFHTQQSFCGEVLGLQPGDKLFSSSRLPFAYGLGNSLSFPLLSGVTTVLCREKPTPVVISEIFKTLRPTVFFGVPVVYSLLLDHHRKVASLDCSSLRLCVSAGEALPARLGEDWQKIFGVEVLDGIGSTEMLHMFMSNHSGAVRYGSSGTVLAGYEAKLLDENSAPTQPLAEGNLWIKGGSAALGYWNRPEETARTFVDEWVRTGDLYRRDAEGYWFHMGRSDDCFKSSGQWVSPVEVEGALLRHDGIGRAAVVEYFDEAGLPGPCAFVIPDRVESDVGKLEQELREGLRSELSRYKQPRKYVFVSELPYTATGKVQRFKLRQALKSGQYK